MFAIRKDRYDLLCAVNDPKNLFGNVGYHKPCDLVFVNGKLTVKDGAVLGIDEPKFIETANRELNRFLQNL